MHSARTNRCEYQYLEYLTLVSCRYSNLSFSTSATCSILIFTVCWCLLHIALQIAVCLALMSHSTLKCQAWRGGLWTASSTFARMTRMARPRSATNPMVNLMGGSQILGFLRWWHSWMWGNSIPGVVHVSLHGWVTVTHNLNWNCARSTGREANGLTRNAKRSITQNPTNGGNAKLVTTH